MNGKMLRSRSRTRSYDQNRSYIRLNLLRRNLLVVFIVEENFYIEFWKEELRGGGD